VAGVAVVLGQSDGAGEKLLLKAEPTRATCGTAAVYAVSLSVAARNPKFSSQFQGCLSSWQTNVTLQTLENIWKWSDLPQRGFYVALALMLAYTVFSLVRFLSRSFAIRRKALAGLTNSAIGPSQGLLAADFLPTLGALRGISLSAPLLGLAGTSYGILVGLSFGSSGSRQRYFALIMYRVTSALITAAVGIVVAIPATFSYNLIRSRLEALHRNRQPKNANPTNLGSFHFAQTLRLRPRFSGLPSYAMIVAPVLASVVSMFMQFHPYVTPTGLPVRVARCEFGTSDRMLVLRLTNEGGLFLNFEPETWSDLPGKLGEIYRSRQSRMLYLYSEEKVPFQTVADAIDVVRSSPAPGPDSMNIKVILVTPQAERECAVRPVRIINRNQISK